MRWHPHTSTVKKDVERTVLFDSESPTVIGEIVGIEMMRENPEDPVRTIYVAEVNKAYGEDEDLYDPTSAGVHADRMVAINAVITKYVNLHARRMIVRKTVV